MAEDKVSQAEVCAETPAQRLQVLAGRVREWCTDERFSRGDCAAAIGSAIVALEVVLTPDEAARTNSRIAQRNLATLEYRVRVAADFLRVRGGDL